MANIDHIPGQSKKMVPVVHYSELLSAECMDPENGVVAVYIPHLAQSVIPGFIH